MLSNLARYESDLKRLIDEGDELHNRMIFDQFPSEFRRQAEAAFGKEGAEKYISELPTFNSGYQKWYSEARATIKQLLPDRLADFVRHYERQANRRALQADNYTIEDYVQGLRRGESATPASGISRMEQQVAILKSARQRFKSSLFDIKQLVAADVFDSEIEAARSLLKGNYLRAAGAVAGVILEKHLSQVCENHSIKVTKKNPSIGDLNDALKNADVIDTPRWRATQHLADIRNLCDHAKSKDPTNDQVEELIDGVARVLRTLF